MSILALLLLAAEPTTLRLAIPRANVVQVAEAEAAMRTEVFAQGLIRRGIQVLTARDMEAILGLDRQKLLAGCTQESCVADLAGALGVDGVVLVDLGHVDGRWTFSARVVSAGDGSTRATWTGDSAGDVTELLNTAAASLALQLTGGVEVAGPRMSRWWALAPGALALAGVGVGLAFQIEAASSLTTLRAATLREDAVAATTQGKAQQTVAQVSFVVAALAAVGTAAILLFGREGPTPIAFLGPQGILIGLQGALP